MAERTLTIDAVEPLLLFGFNDVYLRKIEAAFADVRIVARGNQVKLLGDANALDRVERVLSELTMVLHRNGTLTERDVDTVLDLSTLGQGIQRADRSDVILYTPAGGMVKAKTPNQGRLVELARSHDIVFAVGPAGTGKCVAGDTLVITDGGLLPIASLVEGTEAGDNPPLRCTVAGLDGPESTSHFYDGGESDTVRIRVRRGFAIEATPEHPLLVLTPDGSLEWRRADALCRGDMLALQRGQRMFGTDDRVDFSWEPAPSGGRAVSLDRLDPAFAYVVGLIVGDGCLSPSRSVLLSTADEEVRHAFEEAAARFGLQVRQRSAAKPHDYIVNSQGLRDLLVHLGCSTGPAATKQIPDTILRAPEPVVVAFLQGLFDADGTVAKRDGVVSLTTVSETLAQQVQTLLLNLGVVATRAVKRGRYAGRPHYSFRLTMAGAEAERFHDRVGFRLARKRDRRKTSTTHNVNLDVVPHVAALIDRAVRLVTLSRAQHKRVYDYRTGRRAPSYAKPGDMLTMLDAAGAVGEAVDRLHAFADRHLLFLPVESLETGRARVYDLTVPGTHSFVANGFVNHNTYTAVALAVSALRSRQVKRIVLSRPAVEAGESLGFLPGDFRDKIDPYLRPLYDALEEMIPREKLRAYTDQNTVEIVPLAYMRGRTLSNAFVILDEAQNATTAQMKMFLTRLGVGSRAIVTGDATQTDLPRRSDSGLIEATRILRGVDGIGFLQFDKGDVVRHQLVKDIIDAYERDSNDG